ncbi:SPFH domain-containing protein [Zooshikella ganghwensis]|uniref:SPFH domain-containing protein n=1 Tax=Zooshikella ganghwensis TaxID=202772 RepID=UPI000414BADC|nr:SPFH domain-containing protein [Zooshikella ganghwensis]
MKKSVITFLGFYVVNQDELGVRLTLGKFSGQVAPGLGFCIPILQKIYTTKSSIQTIDLPNQQVVLNGNVSVTISGTVHFRVVDSEQALLEVVDYQQSIKQLALTTISDVIGTKTIEEVRGQKASIAAEIEDVIRGTTKKWGLGDIDIRLTDASMEPNLLRAMMRETEAKKEATAQRIKAESDQITADIFCKAARLLASSPGAMTLRILQTLSDISSDKSTVVVPIPIELLSGSNSLTAQYNDIVPVADIEMVSDQVFCYCPSCEQRFNISEVTKNERYDKNPDLPGIQLSCTKCKTLFSVSKMR